MKAERDKTKQNIAKALEVMQSRAMPDISPSHCRLNCIKEWLAIYRTLTPVEPESIYDLCSVTNGRIGKLEKLGITKLVDIPDDFDLTDKQARQVRVFKEGRALIESDKIKAFLGTLQYPLYFFDYETLMSTVPYFDGTKPYQQIPFQYSLHILDNPEAELRHVEYLHKENSNPAESLSQALKRDIGMQGSVIVWNQSFEKNCNTLLGTLLPNYAEFYEALNERILDLMLPFSGGWYIHKDFCGSASIKKVLPVLIPELTYKSLGIQDGGAAQRLWMEAILDGKRDHEKQQILNDLAEYCKLDTLAMVKIYEYLVQIAMHPKVSNH